MQRNSVTSSRVNSIGFENDTLEVEFKDHSVYQYYNVSYSEYQSLINSDSIGSYISVIDKNHRYIRIY